MKLLPLAFLCAALASALPARASDETASSASKPGLLSRMLHPFRKTAPPEASTAATKGTWRQLSLTMTAEPLPLKLPETRQLKVTLVLENHSKRFVQLEFPSTQRIEVVIKGAGGKMVEQWSEDRAFTSDPGMVSINPGERLVYAASVATRDLVAGESYTLEAFFPNYEGLRVVRNIVPVK